MRRSRYRRSQPIPRPRKRRRLGTFFFIVGILAVLGATFAVGALAGRFSLRPASVASAKTVDRPAKPAPPPQPELTFYRELVAPLATPPVPAKPVPRPPVKREPAPAAPAATEGREPVAASTVTRADGARYTVQVGAFTAREQAEAMRARLAASGHAAYVVEGDAAAAPRYRVRIGVFTTAEDARQAAARLASAARVATYVTTEHGGSATRTPHTPTR
jgi:cell division protein FtsN